MMQEMIDFLKKVFEESGFEEQALEWDGIDSITYNNCNSETYILIFNEINEDLPDKIITFCSEQVYITEKLTKAQKSNLSIVVVSEITDELTELQKKIIFKIEENDLYYKKFLLWFSKSELEELNKRIISDFTIEYMNELLLDKKSFDDFKNKLDSSVWYSLLSRVFIKLAFLTLNDIEVLDKNLLDYIKEEISILNIELYNTIQSTIEKEDLVDKTLELIDMSEDEIKKIDVDLESKVKLNDKQ